jgi:hypothetical protein
MEIREVGRDEDGLFRELTKYEVRCSGQACNGRVKDVPESTVSQRNKKEETKIETIKRGANLVVSKQVSAVSLVSFSRQASRGACLVEVSKQTSSRSQTKRLLLPHNNLQKHPRAQLPFQAQSTPNLSLSCTQILPIRFPSLSPSPALSSALGHSLHLLRGPAASTSQFVVLFPFIQSNHVVRIRTYLPPPLPIFWVQISNPS